jgi:hypothetical protein
MPTAVLIDGGYFIKRFRRIEPHNSYDADRAAELAHRWAMAHLKSPGGEKRDLYRIFFYDCPPLMNSPPAEVPEQPQKKDRTLANAVPGIAGG